VLLIFSDSIYDGGCWRDLFSSSGTLKYWWASSLELKNFQPRNSSGLFGSSVERMVPSGK